VLGGLPLFVLAGSGAATVLLLQRRNARQLMLIGAGALLAGIALTLVAVDVRSTASFFVGAVIAGIGFGGAFQGAIRSVVPLAAPHQRAGVLSVVYVVSYLALGLPAVIAGVLLVHEGNLVKTSVQFGVAVMVLAALALAGALRPARPAADPRPGRDEYIEPEQAREMCSAERA
jgi:MFS family permease